MEKGRQKTLSTPVFAKTASSRHFQFADGVKSWNKNKFFANFHYSPFAETTSEQVLNGFHKMWESHAVGFLGTDRHHRAEIRRRKSLSWHTFATKRRKKTVTYSACDIWLFDSIWWSQVCLLNEWTWIHTRESVIPCRVWIVYSFVAKFSTYIVMWIQIHVHLFVQRTTTPPRPV